MQWSLKIRNCDFIQDEDGYKLLNPPLDSLFKALSYFRVRSWFTQVWVVKEALLVSNPVPVCGSQYLNWNCFVLTALLLKQAHFRKLLVSPYVPRVVIELVLNNVFTLTMFQKQAPRGLHILQFIDLLDYCHCRKITEPMDRVWVHLGVTELDLQQAAAPLVDYSLERNRDYYKAYTNMEKIMLQRGPKLYFLSIILSLQRPPGLPSWWPDFHSARGGGSDMSIFPSEQDHQKKDKSAPLIEFTPNSNIL